MDQATRTRIEHNIFPLRIKLVNHGKSPWHAGRGGAIDTHVAHSSQALGIDVFGTLEKLHLIVM